MHNADIPGSHVDYAAGNIERRHLARPAGQQLRMIIFDGCKAPYAGTHCDANPMAILLSNFQARVAQCIFTRCYAVVHERIHAPRIFTRDIRSYIEINNGARDLRGIVTYIEVFDLADSGSAFANILPGLLERIANGRDNAHAGNYDTSLTH